MSSSAHITKLMSSRAQTHWAPVPFVPQPLSFLLCQLPLKHPWQEGDHCAVCPREGGMPGTPAGSDHPASRQPDPEGHGVPSMPVGSAGCILCSSTPSRPTLITVASSTPSEATCLRQALRCARWITPTTSQPCSSLPGRFHISPLDTQVPNGFQWLPQPQAILLCHLLTSTLFLVTQFTPQEF